MAAITNCYSRAGFTTYSHSCGFAGFLGNGSSIDKCYAANSGDPAMESGFCETNDGAITNSYWDTELSGTEDSDGGTGKTTAQMKTLATYSGWDFSAIWGLAPTCNGGYPCLLLVTSGCSLSGDFAHPTIPSHPTFRGAPVPSACMDEVLGLPVMTMLAEYRARAASKVLPVTLTIRVEEE